MKAKTLKNRNATLNELFEGLNDYIRAYLDECKKIKKELIKS